ncbi:MAG: ATP-binding protein [Verrucomicrobiota bacterium]|jgi:signal transduction histidine kinase/ActR/RegA family two-component response regulator
MKDQQSCRVLVINDTAGLLHHLRTTLPSADLLLDFQIDDLPRNADSMAHLRNARAAGRPYSVVFLDPGPPPALDVFKTLARLWAEDPALQAVICAGPSDPAPEEMARQLSQSSHWLLLKKPYLPGEARQMAACLAHTHITAAGRSTLEAQLRQSQKMESVGQLASGIAHDFNNLLTVISGHVGMLLADQPDNPRTAESLKEIAEASKRASELTRQLTTFSRKHPLHLQVADLNEIVNNVGKMLRRILGEDIALTVDFSPGLPSIKADLGMMEQVLLNLAVNSRDAMPKGGQLLIRTSAVLVEPAQTRLNPDAVAGRFVCLTFQDSGSGIAPEHLSRIFEPFFTTKELGRGTGLGLATVYGIVKQHQGWIQVNSSPGEGTTFHVHLPAWHEESAPLQMPSTGQKVIGGTETILLVEDEVPLLKLMHHILESFGYKVLDSSNGKDALEIWRQHQKKIDLLLTDLILPDGMAGFELAKLLQADKPALKIIYTSGYDTERLAQELMPPADAKFIQKPFHARKLAEAVFESLSRK